MPGIAVICLLLLLLSTVIHYEALRLLSVVLPHIRIAPRSKLIAVVLTTFAAHATEMLLYAVAYYLIVHQLNLGTLVSEPPGAPPSLSLCFYFSAETFTSLGYGDIRPSGPLRLLAGAEALNGLLLIGWSASFAYISMERFWDARA